MKQNGNILFLLLIGLWCLSCENDIEAVNELFRRMEPGVEVARDVDMLYSDSAHVRIRM